LRLEDLEGPVDVQLLPNGRFLIAENHASRVTERNRAGKIVWQKQLSGSPLSCQRLPNGRTFIATTDQMLEVTPEGREIPTLKPPLCSWCIRRLPSGDVAVLGYNTESAGRPFEFQILTNSGKVRSRNVLPTTVCHGSQVTVLPNGDYLLCFPDYIDPLYRGVKQFSATREERRCYTGSWQASCATCLPDGHLLICSLGHRILEIDQDGKVVHQEKTQGRPWHVQVLP
jgi:hypothetical protein